MSRKAWGVVLLAGAAVLGAAVLRWGVAEFGLAERLSRPVAPAPRPNHIIAQLENGARLVMPGESPEPAPRSAVPCAFEPVLPPASPRDGRYRLAEGTGAVLSQPAAYLQVAGEAVAAGRKRDAEVALIMACRASDAAADGQDGAELAAARKRLAHLYLDQAASAADAGAQAQYRERAQLLREAAGDRMLIWIPVDGESRRHGTDGPVGA